MFILRQGLKVPSLLQMNMYVGKDDPNPDPPYLTSQVLRLQPVLPQSVWGCAGDWTCIARQALYQHSWPGTCYVTHAGFKAPVSLPPPSCAG